MSDLYQSRISQWQDYNYQRAEFLVQNFAFWPQKKFNGVSENDLPVITPRNLIS